MIDNKYELRSEEVQEIMRKPPHMFITKGNILILSLLSIAFYFLNRFPLFEKELVPVEVTNVYKDVNQNKNIKIALALNTTISKNVRQNQTAKLLINNIKSNTGEILDGKIDSIAYTSYNVPILYFESNQLSAMPKQGMIGKIEIITKKKTFISMLLERFRH